MMVSVIAFCAACTDFSSARSCSRFSHEGFAFCDELVIEDPLWIEKRVLN
tara:strand:+ start:290 stop:439 length:150 start_codon:yes stop_codon:yes gene_type:complete